MDCNTRLQQVERHPYGVIPLVGFFFKCVCCLHSPVNMGAVFNHELHIPDRSFRKRQSPTSSCQRLEFVTEILNTAIQSVKSGE